MSDSERRRAASRAAERERRDARRQAQAIAMGARIRGLRGFRGYTQAQLSERTGLSRNYLSDLEQGRRPRPRPETLVRLATALGVTPQQLRGETPLPSSLGGPEGRPEENAPPPPAAPEAPPVAFDQETRRLIGRLLGPFLTQLLSELPPGIEVSHAVCPNGGVVIRIRPAGAAPLPRRRTRVQQGEVEFLGDESGNAGQAP